MRQTWHSIRAQLRACAEGMPLYSLDAHTTVATHALHDAHGISLSLLWWLR